MEKQLTAKMHSEFTITKEEEQKHRAGCVWDVVLFDAPREKIEHWASRYGVTYEECMKWKSYWKNLHYNSKSGGL